MTSCFCLLDVIVELHVVDEKMLNDFLIKNCQSGFYITMKACVIQASYFVYIVEPYITLLESLV